jgi:hypothetical protein
MDMAVDLLEKILVKALALLYKSSPVNLRRRTAFSSLSTCMTVCNQWFHVFIDRKFIREQLRSFLPMKVC